MSDQGDSYSYSDRERTLAEFVYEQGFWDGVRAAQEATVALPEKWIERNVAGVLDCTTGVLVTRGLTR